MMLNFAMDQSFQPFLAHGILTCTNCNFEAPLLLNINTFYKEYKAYVREINNSTALLGQLSVLQHPGWEPFL
jgi:hypothetical protein